MSTPGQREHWNTLRRRNLPPITRHGPSSFAQQWVSRLGPGSRILELGCGTGHDAGYFASRGHIVCASDFSSAALAPARALYGAIPGLDFCLLDTTAPLPFRDGAFDAVYAYLSLHYFTDQVTRGVFGELRRVLVEGGLLGFACKTTGDPLYGQGRLVEPDMFEHHGHLRHFFSPEYARACLASDFDRMELEERRGDLFGRKSDWIEVIARARSAT